MLAHPGVLEVPNFPITDGPVGSTPFKGKVVCRLGADLTNMDKELKRLIAAADRASNKTRWGYYPMAPSIGLSEREIQLHQKALDAHGAALEAAEKVGLESEVRIQKRAIDNHSWVTTRVGNFS